MSWTQQSNTIITYSRFAWSHFGYFSSGNSPFGNLYWICCCFLLAPSENQPICYLLKFENRVKVTLFFCSPYDFYSQQIWPKTTSGLLCSHVPMGLVKRLEHVGVHQNLPLLPKRLVDYIVFGCRRNWGFSQPKLPCTKWDADPLNSSEFLVSVILLLWGLLLLLVYFRKS